MWKIALALVGALFAARAAAEPTGGYVAAPFSSPLLGSDGNGSLARVTLGAAGAVLQSTGSGVTWATPAAGVTSSALDTLFGTTQGSIVYRNASAWVSLGPGTTGQVLQSGGASANPAWAAAASVTYGTTAGTAAQGNDSRITGALQAATAATTYDPLNIAITSTYTASGAIATSDGYSLVNCSANCVMTLASGTTDGHRLTVKRYGAGAVSIAATVDGTATTIEETSTTIKESVDLFWSATLSSWVLK